VRRILARPLYWLGCLLYDAGEKLLILAARIDGTLERW
jgi:hypothetical protein